jgi:hypothetical protein
MLRRFFDPSLGCQVTPGIHAAVPKKKIARFQKARNLFSGAEIELEPQKARARCWGGFNRRCRLWNPTVKKVLSLHFHPHDRAVPTDDELNLRVEISFHHVGDLSGTNIQQLLSVDG